MIDRHRNWLEKQQRVTRACVVTNEDSSKRRNKQGLKNKGMILGFTNKSVLGK